MGIIISIIALFADLFADVWKSGDFDRFKINYTDKLLVDLS